MSTRYYPKNKERLRKKTRERYQNLSEKEKNKICQYSREQYRNLPKDEKQRLVEYRKNDSKIQKIKTA